MSDQKRTILLIGASGTGKTHYGGQLLIRLNEGEGSLKMKGMPENITPYEEAERRLGQGMLSGHTSEGTYRESIFPVESKNGRRSNLVWPDYAGEQVSQLVESRRVNKAWLQRLAESEGWILFIRLDNIRVYEDMLSRPVGQQGETAKEGDKLDFLWSSQAIYVELVQLLLLSKGVGTINRVTSPALTVLLTCWDELGEAGQQVDPAVVLREKMPLFADFLRATWHPDKLSVYGLSALGKSLKKDEPDPEYLERGPEAFGYVVLSNGAKDPDLTLPVSRLMEQVA
jgi:hypothetical protein